MTLHLSFRDIQPRYFPDITADDINKGNCFNWALIAKWEYPNINIELCTVQNYGGHAFIKIGERYFDSAHPTGSPDWHDMLPWVDPLYDEDLQIQDEESFIEHWAENGGFQIWNKQMICKSGRIQRIRRGDSIPDYTHYVEPLVPKMV